MIQREMQKDQHLVFLATQYYEIKFFLSYSKKRWHSLDVVNNVLAIEKGMNPLYPTGYAFYITTTFPLQGWLHY